jgi:hypothetical protein
MGTKYQEVDIPFIWSIYLLSALYLVLRMNRFFLRNSKDCYLCMDGIEAVKNAQTPVSEAFQNCMLFNLD